MDFESEVVYHIENLKNMDPDYVVDFLNLSSEEIVEAFLSRAIRMCKEEFGE